MSAHVLGLREQHDAGHLRLLVHDTEEGIETILGLHGVDVVELLPHERSEERRVGKECRL